MTDFWGSYLRDRCNHDEVALPAGTVGDVIGAEAVGTCVDCGAPVSLYVARRDRVQGDHDMSDYWANILEDAR